MDKVFKYSKFFKIQPLFLSILACFFWIIIFPSIRKNGLDIPSVVIFLFGLYLFIRGMVIFTRRRKELCYLQVNSDSIGSVYSGGKCISQKWEDITSAKKLKRGQLQLIILDAKDGSQISFSDGIHNFNTLLNIIEQHVEIK
jgi:hypothetical protein